MKSQTDGEQPSTAYLAVRLPNFQECADAPDEERTPLHAFIWENSLFIDELDALFRTQLAAVLNQVSQMAREADCEVFFTP